MFRLRIDEHVELRQPDFPDAPALFAAVDRDRDHLRAWLPWVDRTRAPEDVSGFLALSLRQYAENNGFQAAIVVDGALSGMIGFHGVNRAHRSTSIGYWLASGCQGRGIVTRACGALIKHAFLEWDVHRIEIRCATGNVRSRAIPERLGFTAEGTVREAEWLYDRWVDHAVYGLLRREWTGG
jgi:ribosomal-protein-serine acetyltransferase